MIEMTLENVTSALWVLNGAKLLRENAELRKWLGGRESDTRLFADLRLVASSR
jgi:hypothetical protein